MRRFALLLVSAGMMLAALNLPCLAQDFRPYAGSSLDEKYSREASKAAPDKESQVYTTNDTFDQVYAFYKTLYKEHTMRASPPKLPTGQQIRWAFFIIDGGKDLVTSKHWMKIQWPFVDGTDGKDIRQVTVIQVVRAK